MLLPFVAFEVTPNSARAAGEVVVVEKLVPAVLSLAPANPLSSDAWSQEEDPLVPSK